ncbi:AAA family ATPase [Shewanella woodyi]|uniref:AAA ATPase n=1 Tax=Shewanella woodyi (strain ATCC 51908 / MS32) TaxID=392500 RepID=B1KQ97_SHEWM|nr:AAA family ATPase [Shewanella woodyi]ACA84752.1 AAA ATPase [Shewanella woodyi ATCC 51908]
MKIKIRNKHKSIPAGLEFELPQFTVLTGENGSGKTHLFEAISDKKNGQVTLEEGGLNSISYIPFGGLNPQVDQQCDPAQISQKVKQVWQEVANAKLQIERRSRGVEYTGAPEGDPILNHVGNAQHKEAILSISQQLSILPSQLTEDIISDRISMMSLSGSNLFNSQFALIFKSYHVRYLDNKLNKVYEDEGTSDANPYLKDEEFKEQYGEAPWDFVNGILAKLCLPYTVNNPINSKRDSTFVFKLIHNQSGIEIGTNDLSTGEKTLMSLALAIYNSIGTGDRADCLILDEPDAPLHPSMSKLMLEIVEEEIVQKHGIPVLLSTHSPTTIACTPANALYKITAAEKIPTQCDLHDSMRILTYGIPNLRVSTEHRRQIFVEHTYDVEYYESLFDIISRKIEFVTIPQFLPPHTNNGSNCDAVLEITRKLRDMGNSQVYGLIDWDLKNEPEQQVVILGLGRRYAIENYIFEPHFLGLYLIHKKFASPEELGLEGCNSYLDVITLISNNSDAIQIIVDSVQEKLLPEEETSSYFESFLIDESSIRIDQRILDIKGHTLEDLARESWPQLNCVRSNNGGDSVLKKDVISTVINDFPGLISIDIADTFRELR